MKKKALITGGNSGIGFATARLLKNIRINGVAPGAIETPMFDKMGFSKKELQRIRRQKEVNIPLHRYGRAEEVG